MIDCHLCSCPQCRVAFKDIHVHSSSEGLNDLLYQKIDEAGTAFSKAWKEEFPAPAETYYLTPDEAAVIDLLRGN